MSSRASECEPARVLVVAKAPVPGLVKTRLGAEIGMTEAANFAAAALLDTLATASAAFEERHIALAGNLDDAVRKSEIAQALAGWVIHDQRGADFGARLANAHHDAQADGRMVVQIGMDTPQVSTEQLLSVARSGRSAVLGPAPDGGWWVLGLRAAHAAVALESVEMSTPQTFANTRRALLDLGVDVAVGEELRDLDTAADVAEVLTGTSDTAGKEFARAWQDLSARAGGKR